MNFHLDRIIEDKRRLRRDLAALPIEEKLRILDALRERELAIRGNQRPSDAFEKQQSPKPGRAL